MAKSALAAVLLLALLGAALVCLPAASAASLEVEDWSDDNSTSAANSTETTTSAETTTTTTTTTAGPSSTSTSTVSMTTSSETTSVTDSNNTTSEPSTTTTGSQSTGSTIPGLPTTTTGAPSEIAQLKAGILAGGWIPFTIILVVSLVFAFSYVRYYQHKRERECGSTTIAVLALTVALLTAALVPVDIYLVSHLQGKDGKYETDSTRNGIKDMMTYAYYAMYALTQLFVFLLLPMAYFFFEEKDEEAGTTTCKRFLTALKYTAGFIIIFGVLMCIGAFAIHSDGATCNTNSSVTDQIQCKAEFAEHALTANGGTNAISFTIGALTVIGFIYFIMYGGYGMVSLPIEMIRSRGRVNKEEREHAEEDLRVSREKQDTIKAKYGGKRKKMSSSDRARLFKQEETSRVIERAQSRLDELENGCWSKVGAVCRPFEFIFGIIFFLLGIFLVVSLLMTTLDKLLQIEHQHLGFKDGYSRVKPHVINPVDKMLTLMQKVFPLDYIFMTLAIYYFLLCIMSGVRALSVRFCCLKMFKIRPRRTVPQGILFMCMILIFSMLALNVLLLTLMPQYVTYGNQHFPAVSPRTDCINLAPDTQANSSLCSYEAPGYLYYVRFDGLPHRYLLAGENASVAYHQCGKSPVNFCNVNLTKNTCQRDDFIPEPCTQTRMVALLQAFFYNAWFFGAIYFWANWGIIGVFFIALVWLTCRQRRSLMQVLVNDVQEDYDDSDDDMAPFNPSWK